MRSCTCGAALDYAPDDVTRCYGCRQTAPATDVRKGTVTVTGIDRAPGCAGLNWQGLPRNEVPRWIQEKRDEGLISELQMSRALHAFNLGKDGTSFLQEPAPTTASVTSILKKIFPQQKYPDPGAYLVPAGSDVQTFEQDDSFYCRVVYYGQLYCSPPETP